MSAAAPGAGAFTFREAAPVDGAGVERVIALATADLRKVYRPRPAARTRRAGTATALATAVCMEKPLR